MVLQALWRDGGAMNDVIRTSKKLVEALREAHREEAVHLTCPEDHTSLYQQAAAALEAYSTCMCPEGVCVREVLNTGIGCKRARHEPSTEQAERDDMENVGRAFMERLHEAMPEYSWCNCPSEVIYDLINQRDEARAAQPPVPEPHVIKQIEHALQDNPNGISREMADYITGAIADYRYALTKEGNAP